MILSHDSHKIVFTTYPEKLLHTFRDCALLPINSNLNTKLIINFLKCDMSMRLLLLLRLSPNYLGSATFVLNLHLSRFSASLTHTPAALTPFSIASNHLFFGLPLPPFPSTDSRILIRSSI